jgi:hypothetical protein
MPAAASAVPSPTPGGVAAFQPREGDSAMRLRRTRTQLRCRGAGRHVRRLDVRPHVDRRRGALVWVALDGAEPVLLTPLQVGWLRRQLRTSVFEAVEQADAWRAAEREESA